MNKPFTLCCMYCSSTHVSIVSTIATGVDVAALEIECFSDNPECKAGTLCIQVVTDPTLITSHPQYYKNQQEQHHLDELLMNHAKCQAIYFHRYLHIQNIPRQ